MKAAIRSWICTLSEVKLICIGLVALHTKVGGREIDVGAFHSDTNLLAANKLLPVGHAHLARRRDLMRICTARNSEWFGASPDMVFGHSILYCFAGDIAISRLVNCVCLPIIRDD